MKQDVSAHVAETMPDFLLIALGHVPAEAGRPWALADPREKESLAYVSSALSYVVTSSLLHSDTGIKEKPAARCRRLRIMIRQGAWHV